MSKYIITGGKKLQGEIKVSGSKNAVLPLMAACLLTDKECVLTNVPKIVDVEIMSEVLRDLGVEVNFDKHTLKIHAATLKHTNPHPELFSKLRGSILLLGPLLARQKAASISFPGGDIIGKRPIDAHIRALKDLGAEFKQTDNTLEFKTEGLVGNKIVLWETSVTATENAMMAAVLAKGTTVIKLSAMEPHVQQLGLFLKKMGAKIKGLGTPTITIEGVDSLSGAKIKVIPDSEEAASLITLAAATKSQVRVSRLNPEFLEDYLLKLSDMKVNFEVGPDYIQINEPKGDYSGLHKLQCGLYPKLNSDYVPPMAVLATQSSGETIIHEWLYETRLSYVDELKKMGAVAEVLDPHRVKITGPVKLTGQEMTGYDLRMGMTLVIAALVADGKSEISDIHHIDRGYENLEGRLRKLGASIKRVN